MARNLERLTDLVAGGVVLAFAAGMHLAARAEPPALYDPLGSGTAARYVSLVLGALALILLLTASFGMRVAQSQQSLIVGLDGQTDGDYALRPWLAAFVMVATAGYAALLTAGVPFRWSTMLFLFVLGAAMGDRSRRHAAIAAAVAVIGAVAIDTVFSRLLLVQLP
jgi:hypothetical protein